MASLAKLANRSAKLRTHLFLEAEYSSIPSASMNRLLLAAWSHYKKNEFREETCLDLAIPLQKTLLETLPISLP